MWSNKQLKTIKNLARFLPLTRAFSPCGQEPTILSGRALTSLGNLFGNHHLLRHCHQLGWIGTGPLMTGGEQLQSIFTNFDQDLTKTTKGNSSFGISTKSSPLLLQTWISGRHHARQISSDVSKSTGHDEDVKVKDGVLDVKDDDDLLLGLDDVDTASLPLSGKSTESKSERELLWGKLENCKLKGEAITKLQLYISGGHTFTSDDSVFVISKLKRSRRYVQAAEILDWILETKMFPWTSSYQVLRISVKGNLGKSIEVEKTFNDSSPEFQTEIAYNAVIKHFCEKGMVKKANEWLDRLMKSGLITHAFVFNRLLDLYKDKNMGEKVKEVLDAMDAFGIAKDVYTYNILMSIKSKQNDVAGIENVFDGCKADPNVKVDPATYATLAGSYINLGLKEKAAAALEEGESIGFERTGNVDEVMATLWGKLGNKEKVLSLWELMKQKQTVGARTYVVMIETFGKLGMVDQAEALFHEMKATIGKVRPRQFTALLATYANNNLFDKAETLVASISSMELNRSPALNHHIVSAYLKMGQPEKALAVLTEAQGKGGTPLWFTTMVALLNAVAETGDIIRAEKLFDNMFSTYKQKSRAVYNTLLKAYAKAGVPADGFLLRMSADKIPPNKTTLELLQQSGNTTGGFHSRESILATATVES